MKLGFCISHNSPLLTAAASHFDYLEYNAQEYLQAMNEDEPALARAETPAEACNCLVPGSLKICGPDVNPESLRLYMERATKRAMKAGIKTLVFGSGAARAVPEGWSREKASEQILDFLRISAPFATFTGITIVIEPLRRAECNILNTVTESAEYVREINLPCIRLLADSYHWANNGESEEALREVVPLLAHVHVATTPHRALPASEECVDLPRFCATLRDAGYDGRVSIECGGFTGADGELSVAADYLRRALS